MVAASGNGCRIVEVQAEGPASGGGPGVAWAAAPNLAFGGRPLTRLSKRCAVPTSMPPAYAATLKNKLWGPSKNVYGAAVIVAHHAWSVDTAVPKADVPISERYSFPPLSSGPQGRKPRRTVGGEIAIDNRGVKASPLVLCEQLALDDGH